MKIILAPDSFKDSLSGIDVCSILAEAARRELGDVEIRCFPMGDGGEGTLDAVLAATNGRRETLLVRDPLGRWPLKRTMMASRMRLSISSRPSGSISSIVSA